MNYTDLIARLRGSPPNVLLQREAAEAIEALERRVRQFRRDVADEQRASAIESRWQDRCDENGVPHGTY